MYEYLKDSYFLQQLENMNIKIQYIKLVVLDFKNEIPIREIQGQVQAGGTINVNGSSSLRRTISFTMYADAFSNDLTNIDNLISLNKKIKIMIGYKNLVQGYEHYGDIIWFKGGTYIVSTASIANSTSGSNITIQAKDKMVLLNGMAGGTIAMPLVLHERYEEVKNEDGTTSILITHPSIYQIIYETVSQFGGEITTNIVVSDLPQTAKMLVKYIGNKKFYLAKDLSTFLEADSSEELTNSGLNPADYYEYSYGQDVGYQETDFTFPGDLTFAAGSTVTQVLDKICQTFGNYEYFYDLDGKFIFQEKKNYLNNAYTPLTELGVKQYVKQFSDSKYIYSFNNLKEIISINYSPKYENLKNDFVVWGQRTSASGSKLPIRFHLAIDSKPQIKLASKYMYKVEEEGTVYRYTFYNEPLIGVSEKEVLIGYPCADWREELYRAALIREKDGVMPNVYDMELLAEWRKIYDSSKVEWRSSGQERATATDDYWNPLVFTSPGTLDYWLEFLDGDESLQKYSCASLGRRTKVVNANNVTSIFNGEIQDIIFLENLEDSEEIFHFELDPELQNTDYSQDLLAKIAEYKDIVKLENYDSSLEEIKRQELKTIIDNRDYKIYEYYKAIYSKAITLENNSTDFYWPLYESEYYGLPYNLDRQDLVRSGVIQQIENDIQKKVTQNNFERLYNNKYGVNAFKIALGYYSTTKVTTQEKADNYRSLGQKFIITSPQDMQIFSVSSTGASAFDTLRDTIYQLLVYNTTSSITCTPKYYLEPNQLIHIGGGNGLSSGDFVISQFSLPLNYNGTMSITGIEALTRM